MSWDEPSPPWPAPRTPSGAAGQKRTGPLRSGLGYTRCSGRRRGGPPGHPNPTPGSAANPDAWRENDRLRADASRILVDAALVASVAVYVQPTVTFVYPPEGPACETTPIARGVAHPALSPGRRDETERFARAGLSRRGVVLRLGLLDEPGTGHSRPIPTFGATVHVARQLASCFRLSPCPAGSTTSAVTANAPNGRFSQAAGWHPSNRNGSSHSQRHGRPAARERL